MRFHVQPAPPFGARRVPWWCRLHRFIAWLIGAGCVVGMVGCKKKSDADVRYEDVRRLSDGTCVEMVDMGRSVNMPVKVACPPAEMPRDAGPAEAP